MCHVAVMYRFFAVNVIMFIWQVLMDFVSFIIMDDESLSQQNVFHSFLLYEKVNRSQFIAILMHG